MKLFYFLGISLISSSLLAEVPDAKSILAAAEVIRNPKVSYVGKIKITDQRPGTADDVRTYKVSSRDNSTAIVDYLTPVTDAGTRVLMVNDDMWVALPKASKPIRVAPKNKVVGNAAYGDIATISYVEGYDPTFKEEKKIENKDVYVLDLKAKDGKNVTYDRIEYWVEKATSRPVKAFYMTSAGKVLREGVFTGYRKVLGMERPLVLVLTNHLDQKLTTKIELVDAEQKSLPQSLFQKSALK